MMDVFTSLARLFDIVLADARRLLTFDTPLGNQALMLWRVVVHKHLSTAFTFTVDAFSQRHAAA